MAQMNIENLTSELIVDEALKLKPYHCTAGKLTIGIGRNLEDVGISTDEARYLLKNDIDRVCAQLDAALPWWRTMSERRQRVLANMCFNMGIGNSTRGLLSFRNTLASMQRGDYRAAARGMRDSSWAKQVGARAERLAKMMEEG
ncbi:glycoside hydrolase family protein [Noviherbaspirillum sp. Root189]|uniref:glycoside hydrolase family protein n=1 Tax=Noviherbaspirillum sp. Root189 TaxID=1736487 RepID=UPI00070D95C5|nr:glycoside hydrolase family protein [Noviherbaspirillum sp. Root189]KRB73436.1 lysozyme [Noviherbaspirillum sp. Root189]